MAVQISADAVRYHSEVGAGIHSFDRDLTVRIGRLVLVEELDDALGALLRPVLAGRRYPDQNMDRAVGREVLRLGLAERSARGDETLPDKRLARVARGAFSVVDVRRYDDDTLLAS